MINVARGFQSTFDSPSVIQQSRQDSMRFDPGFGTPLRRGLSFSIISYQAVPASVISLFLRCRPAAVGRFVVSVVVYPIQSVFRRRLLAHVGQEVFKGRPTSTDFYSSSTVMRPLCRPRVFATLAHSIPGRIRTALNSPAMPVSLACATQPRGCFAHEATA